MISLASPPLPAAIDAGLLVLRVSLGYFLIVHGLQKVDPRMDGGGLEAETQRLVADGIRDNKALAAFSALTQVGAGAILSLGLLTPLAAAAAIGVMVVATTTKLRHGFWVWTDGAEFPIFLCLAAITVALSGPGRWSLDGLIGLTPKTSLSLGAVVLGILAGLGSVPILREPHTRNTPAAPSADLTTKE